MNLVKEYKNQSKWRDWTSYMESIPTTDQDLIYDFGCSIGVVSKLLSEKVRQVTGIDSNPELLKEAVRINSAENISYLEIDLGSSDLQDLPKGDGIWASFVTAYFPDFEPILNAWIRVLRRKGWIAIVELNDLFAHEPLSEFARDVFENYSQRQCRNNLYDFKMGTSLLDYVKKCGLSVIHEQNMYDPEFSFTGPAGREVLKSWECRFDRMLKFQDYLGERDFYRIKHEFLDCLSDRNHKSKSVVKFIVARK